MWYGWWQYYVLVVLPLFEFHDYQHQQQPQQQQRQAIVGDSFFYFSMDPNQTGTCTPDVVPIRS